MYCSTFSETSRGGVSETLLNPESETGIKTYRTPEGGEVALKVAPRGLGLLTPNSAIPIESQKGVNFRGPWKFNIFTPEKISPTQPKRVYPYPLGAGSARPNPKMGAPDPENPLFLGFSVLRGALRPWSQTMVSEGARPWGRGRSGDCDRLSQERKRHININLFGR